MTDTDFDKDSLTEARARLTTLFEAFTVATGLSTTAAASVVAGDRAFPHRLHKTNMTFGTYDMIAGRFSALWPESTPWPQGIPRPAPVEVPANLRALFDERRAQSTEEAANG